MRVKIKDVARESGFSITAVSLVLNGKSNNTSQQTKEKIIETAERLGYRPNRLAVGLSKKESKLIGLIIPDNSNMFFSELSKSVEKAARKYGFSLIYGNTNDEYARDIEYLRLFVDHQVDGIIITKSSNLSLEDDYRNMLFIEESGIPYVVVDRRNYEHECNLVTVDGIMGGYLATKHLIENGHTRIGCFTGPVGLSTTNDRLIGYKNALTEANIEIDENIIFNGNFSMGFEKKAMDTFLKQNVSAIFCQNDLMAFGIYRESIKRNIKIPENLSIVGYDNIVLSDIVYPKLTTINQPIDEIARESMKILISGIKNKNIKPQIIELYPSLVVRNSVKKIKEGQR